MIFFSKYCSVYMKLFMKQPTSQEESAALQATFSGKVRAGSLIILNILQ